MHVYERQPYSGKLVFAAFSGSHQDAIAKGMKWREEKGGVWNVPYLPIDPADVGRTYDADVIRINSQSGKGGIGYILESKYKLSLPPKMREVFGYHVKSISDHEHRELLPAEVYDIFMRDFVNVANVIDVVKAHYAEQEGGIRADVVVRYHGESKTVTAFGNGRLNAVARALSRFLNLEEYTLESYTQHALEGKSDSLAASYVSINREGKTYWGTGIDHDIIVSSVKALVSAVNVMIRETGAAK